MDVGPAACAAASRQPTGCRAPRGRPHPTMSGRRQADCKFHHRHMTHTRRNETQTCMPASHQDTRATTNLTVRTVALDVRVVRERLALDCGRSGSVTESQVHSANVVETRNGRRCMPLKSHIASGPALCLVFRDASQGNVSLIDDLSGPLRTPHQPFDPEGRAD